MNDVEKQMGIRNATILMIIAGAFNTYLGYSSFQLAIIIPDSFHTTIGTIMIVCGLLTFCVSLVVWLQKSWAAKLIIGIGVAVCVALIVFGIFLMIIIEAAICWLAINQLKIRRVVDHSDWHVN
ncbi:hypothetical protein E4H12_10370 [Candidatus Thorarchaeota archaeon]|nr:MAG: hypothetical protein E4H12_10370 [Candidatus Thorarchaeota archaeon]